MIRDALAPWANFYLITGTAAAALTGLQFIVQTLLPSVIRRVETDDDNEAGIAAFGTPTVVHFAVSLALSALLCVPWPQYASLRATLGVLGVGALIYSGVVLGRARRQRAYVPTLYDWVWYTVFPGVAYVLVLVAAVAIRGGVEWPLFLVAGSTLLLLCIGIHNAWDTVTYLTVIALRSR